MQIIILIPKIIRFATMEQGTALVEFAITITMLMGLTVSVIGFALGMYCYHFVSSAAHESVRFAVVRGYTWSKDAPDNCSTSAPPNFTMPYDCTASGSDIQNYVQSRATVAINSSKVTIDTTSSHIWPGQTPSGSTAPCAIANSQRCLVKVKVSYTFSFFGIQKLSDLTMNATSQGVILQ
jgi:Flp pilus assembly protein TadG